MSWDLTTSGVAIAKAGVNINSDIWKDVTIMSKFSDHAEGTVCMKTQRDWITTAGGTQIMSSVSDAVSDLIAMDLIDHDTTGYIKGEATLMLNKLQHHYDQIIKDLREDMHQELQK